MKISDQLKYVRDTLNPWATENSGSIEVASSLVHLFAILSIKPGSFRCGVKWVGEDKRGIHEEASMVDREFWVALSYGQSLQINKGNVLTDGQAGGRPIADLVEELRDQVRNLQFLPDFTEVTPDYQAARPLQEIAQDFLIDGFYLKFALGCILPPPGTQSADG